jgi:predicted GIY-YIG superfamily endonuclease
VTPDDFKKTIYWISTSDKHEDWFVVAVDQYVAEVFFAEQEGYPLDYISSEEICVADYEDKEDEKQEAYFPTHSVLVKNGFEIISEDEPTIYWKAGKKYCQGNIIQSVIIEKVNQNNGVYIIAVRDTDLYKIGVTKDIEKRLSQLQTSNPYEFYLLGFYVTDRHRELESLLHKKFRLSRYKREWFKLTPESVKEARHFASEFIGKPIINVDSWDSGVNFFGHDKPLQRDKQDDTNDLPF